MKKHNPDNERIKRKYFAYLKEAKGNSEPTVDTAAEALSRFDAYNKYRSFKAFHFEQAVAFKRHLVEQTAKRTGEPLSKATLHATLTKLKQFFFWLADQPGYKSKLRYSDSDYFNMSEKDMRVATATRERDSPTLEQVKHTIQTMPSGTEIERRNRALLAFTILTGARDSAIASIKLKHVDLAEGCVYQDAREVATKFSKTFTTYFFPVGGEVRQVVEDWVRFLRTEKLWGEDDPLFPSTRIGLGHNFQFQPAGLERAHWSGTEPIRKVFREAFLKAGIPYFNPHSFRKTLARLGEELCTTPEEFKAWSQNLGHEQVLTTFTSYGTVATHRQAALIRDLGKEKRLASDVDDIAEAVFRKMQAGGINLPPAYAPA
jgi:integrase